MREAELTPPILPARAELQSSRREMWRMFWAVLLALIVHDLVVFVVATLP